MRPPAVEGELEGAKELAGGRVVRPQVDGTLSNEGDVDLMTEDFEHRSYACAGVVVSK